MKKVKCEICSTVISNNNLKNHQGSKKCDMNVSGITKLKIEESWETISGEYSCPFCEKCFSKSGISTHIWRMHGDGQKHRPQPKKHISWNRGLTKETDERVRLNGEKVSKTIRQQVKDGVYVPNRMGSVARKELSEKQSLHNSGGKSEWFEVNGIKVQGTYEKIFAEAMTSQAVVWVKPKTNMDLFKYEKEGKMKSYSPDFYLEELDIYVEIKGHWWGDDENKMRLVKSQHQDKKLVVLFGLEKLEEVCKNVKKNINLEPLWSW